MRRDTDNRDAATAIRFAGIAALFTYLLVTVGCTPLDEYVRNGFKVGPNYVRPPVPLADQWIDAADQRVRSCEGDDSHWWTVFNDAVLDDLIQTAYRQNLTLREAGARVLQNRAMLAATVGNMFPQTQVANGNFEWENLSREVANRQSLPQSVYSQWNYGFNMAWELDFWGRFRRSIESANAELNASVDNYDDVLVTLLGDVAATYVQVRTLQQQLAYARQTLGLQRQTLSIAVAKFQGGQSSQLDVNQGKSDVAATEALIEQTQIPLRQATNRLCVLMGMPPTDLATRIGESVIPMAPPDAVVGVPCDLVRRRPDVRKAEREAAAQCAQIGVAMSNLYPQISIDGTFGWSAEKFADLFGGNALRGAVGPSFTWNILNYGRLANNVRAQDAHFHELVAHYQNSLLKAGEDVEDGLVTFLRAQLQARAQTESVAAQMEAFKQAIDQYQGGLCDYNRVSLIQERLVERQQVLAQAQGQIALGLIQVYRALGGGWQIRCNQQPATAELPMTAVIREPASR
jgi:NodT family efflux transporter outer membrane factor (OMF) lipoprotein